MSSSSINIRINLIVLLSIQIAHALQIITVSVIINCISWRLVHNKAQNLYQIYHDVCTQTLRN